MVDMDKEFKSIDFKTMMSDDVSYILKIKIKKDFE